RLLGFETHLPCTTKTVEGAFKHVLDKISREMLKANRCSECAIFPNSPVYVLRAAFERGAACHNLSKDGQRYDCWPASTGRCRRGTAPLAIKWAGSMGIAERQQQHGSD